MSAPFTVEQKVWFGAVCFLGVVFAFLLAPFQGNDEWPHWIRSWTVAEGELKCGAVPKAALDAMRPFPFNPHIGEHGLLKYEHVRAALTDRPPGTLTPQHGYTSAACSYWPLSYIVPGLIAKWVALDRYGTPREGGMIKAFWATRITSWATMCVGALWLALLLPWARNLILAFLSIPEVVQQTVQLNNDLMLFLFTFALIYLVFRKPTWRGVFAIALCVICMSLTKPIYALLGALALPALVELWRTTDRRANAWRMPLAVFLLFVPPLALRKLWSLYVHYDTSIWLPPWDVHPDRQVKFLLHHPWHVGVLFWNQLKDTFSHELMRGSWRSILGALGSSAVEIGPLGYFMIILSIVAAIFSDLTDGRLPPVPAEVTVGTRARRWAWVAAILAVVAIFPAVILAMYVLFTSLESDRVLGVQGRYYLTPLLMLTVFALYRAKRYLRWENPGASRLAGAVAAVGGISTNWYALRALIRYYWML